MRKGILNIASPSVAVVAVLFLAGPAGATIRPLSAAQYAVRPACASPEPGHVGCLALGLSLRRGSARAAPVSRLAAPDPKAGELGYRPADLHAAYELPTSPGSAQTIAIVDAYNDPRAEEDLAAYDAEFVLPACTKANGCFTQVGQTGKASSLPFPKTSAELEAFREGTAKQEEEAEEAIGWGLEISLDIETAHATCQTCHILLVEANETTYESLEAAEQAAVNLGANEITNSWGGPEEGITPAEESAGPFNHPGIVITASAGDQGYKTWDVENEFEGGFTDYPASSPHVISVGGTRLEVGAASTWSKETVWNGSGAGGGGCSVEFTAPAWQQSLSNWSSVGVWHQTVRERRLR